TYRLRPAQQISAFHIAAPVQPAETAPGTEVAQFCGPTGVTLTPREPFVRAAMLYLAERWPQAVTFDALCAAARARLALGASTAQDPRVLAESLLTCYTSASTDLLELHVVPPPVTAGVGDRPLAAPLARLQAARGNRVTNLRHASVVLNDFDRYLLCYLDGA